MLERLEISKVLVQDLGILTSDYTFSRLHVRQCLEMMNITSGFRHLICSLFIKILQDKALSTKINNSKVVQ